jgi:hypothetical protein
MWWRKNKTETVKLKSKSYKRVKKFNESDYIKSTFSHLFHSIKVDDGWFRESDYSEMTFKKRPQGGSYDDEVTLKIKYEDYKEFKIKYIHLISREVYTFDIKDINTNDYDFFYQCYVDLMNESNRIKKERADESLSKIHKVIGKSSLRDSKIEDILN